MKVAETRFELRSSDTEVSIDYRCNYVHPGALNHTATMEVPGQHGTYQVGSVNQPEWSPAGNLYFRGEITDRNDAHSTRQFPDETAAREALWQALYMLLECERRFLKYAVVPADAGEHNTIIVINGREYALSTEGLRNFLKVLK